MINAIYFDGRPVDKLKIYTRMVVLLTRIRSSREHLLGVFNAHNVALGGAIL